ncbi:MAG: diaminopimelate epimerase [Brachybacterium sp.]|nr:diaminopimelate epimerase [Brachybacterium sp.]
MTDAPATARQRLPFAKGHGARNDFVLIEDVDGALDLTAEQVARLAERTAGLGADGVIRVVRTAAPGAGIDHALAADTGADADVPEWFMDYRNADGSLAEMCGNGTRVFAAYLDHAGLLAKETAASGTFDIQTRAGLRRIDLIERPTGGGATWQIRTGMGHARMPGTGRAVRIAGRDLAAVDVDLGNPHTVVMLPEDLALEDLDLTHRPPLNPDPADGANIEFVVTRGTRHIAMRVFERGSGETLACGTGACAAAVAAAQAANDDTREAWRVDLPGGTLTVGWTEDGTVTLSGPAELVAEGTVLL